MTKHHPILVFFVLLPFLCVGCEQPGAGNSGLSTKLQSAVQQAKDAEDRARIAELAAFEQRALAAEKQAKTTEGKYLAAMQRVADEEKLHAETTARLLEAEQRIAAVQSALATKNPAVKVAAENSGLQSTKFLCWNVESDGSDPQVIARQLREFTGYDLFALTEVLPDAFSTFSAALGEKFASVETKSGNTDRMQILYNRERFELVRSFELDEINFEFRYRSPLVVHLRELNSGTEFMVMVNHLARGKADVRTKQAQQLVEWARNQNLPIIALGDYNFDYVFADQNGNEGFREMLKDDIWQWVQPVELVDTNWFDNPAQADGQDDYPGSLLDFAFIAGSARAWQTRCNVIVRPNDFPDDATTSDHRPVELLVN